MLSLINIENNNYNSIDYKFICTNDFEVYCFCPISVFDNSQVLNKSEKKDSDYFLVGGI